MKALVDNYTKEELELIVKNSTSLKEVIDKLGYNTHNGNNSETVKKRIEKYNIDTTHFTSINPIKRNKENVFCENSTASQATLRRWYEKENITYCCKICGQLPEWNNQPLTLILDHINGHNHDNRLENLRWVCPNCNQQLDTTGFKQMRAQLSEKLQKHYFCTNCGKEISSAQYQLCPDCANINRRITKRPTREELKQLIRTISFVKIGKQYGQVTDNTVRKWCDNYFLPRTKKEINSYTNEEWEKI